MKNILCIGELLWDIFDGRKAIGGAPFNVAARAASLGMASYIHTRIGNDNLGGEALGVIKRFGVNGGFVQLDDKLPTGTATVTTINGSPGFVIAENAAYSRIETDEKLLAKIAGGGFDATYFGTLAQKDEISRASIIEVLGALTDADTPLLFLDVNLRKGCYSRESILRCLDYATMLKCSGEEAIELSAIVFNEESTIEGFAVKARASFGLDGVLVTLGDNGCYFSGKDGSGYVPAANVSAVDTVGAGDAFSAAFIECWLNSGNMELSAKRGCEAGARAVRFTGALGDLEAGMGM